jgi:putative salt-induced outer membrane protein
MTGCGVWFTLKLSIAASAALVALPALAEPPATPQGSPEQGASSLPAPVRAMIEAALEDEQEATVRAVLELARKTNPGSDAEIDAIRLAYDDRLAKAKQEREVARIEAIRTAGVFENWDGRGELGGFQSTGNADVIGFTAALTLNKRGYNWRHRLSGRADYQESEGVVGREQYLATYEPNLKLSERIFAFGLGQYEQDRFQGFRGRYTLSSGLRYELVDDGAVTLSAKAGPAWRSTDFVDGTNRNELAALGAFDLSWKVAENITLTNNSNLILQNSNSTLVSQSGAVAKVSGKLSVRLSHTVEYNTQPPAGSVTTDMLSRVTLIYDF